MSSLLGRIQGGDWTVIEKKSGKSLDFSSFISLNVTSESQVLDHPVEQGGFASYNKVKKPLEATVTLALEEGETAERSPQGMLSALEKLRAEAGLLSIVTPDGEIPSVTLTRITYARSASNGLGLLTVVLTFKEVSELPKPSERTTIPVEQARDPASASIVRMGQRQANPVSATGRIALGGI